MNKSMHRLLSQKGTSADTPLSWIFIQESDLICEKQIVTSIVTQQMIHLQVASETFVRARVLVAPQNDAWGDVPYTKQPGLCGEEGDYIHITPGFLVNSSTISTFNSRGQQFRTMHCRF